MTDILHAIEQITLSKGFDVSNFSKTTKYRKLKYINNYLEDNQYEWRCYLDTKSGVIKKITDESKEKIVQGRFSDLTGMTFGRLYVVARAPDRVQPNGTHKVMWWCECSCGNPNLKAIDAYSLTHHKTESCGCIQKEIVRKMFSNPNEVDLSGEYGIGYTSKGERFFFDLEDYEKIKDITWCIGTGNIENYVIGYDKDRKHVLMHRLIMNYDGPCDIDHKHGKETRNDNRKCNLRIATRSQNNMNCNDGNSNTGILGVHQLKDNGKFRAYIIKDHKQINLGEFVNIEDAINARKTAEIEYFQEWSYNISQNSDPEYFNPNERW